MNITHTKIKNITVTKNMETTMQTIERMRTIKIMEII